MSDIVGALMLAFVVVVFIRIIAEIIRAHMGDDDD